jgi:zinc protease
MLPPSVETQAAINAMNEVLGGTFGSRLNMDLRENKHWSYGAGSQILDVSGQRPFVAVAPVQTDRTEQSVAELNKDIRAFLSDQPVTPQELAHIQADETLSLPGSLETIDKVGSSLLRMIEFHWPENYYDTMADRIRALDTSDLDAAAKTVIHPDNFVWVIVGDLAKVEPGIRQLGLGQIHIIDADGAPLRDATLWNGNATRASRKNCSVVPLYPSTGTGQVH